MTTDLLCGLLPEYLLLGLVVVLMLIEIAGRGRRSGGFLFVLTLGAAAAVLFSQLQAGYSAAIVPGEIGIDQFSLVARLVVTICGFVYGVSCLGNDETPKFWMLLTASLLGASVMMVSSGFIPLFLGIELLSLPGFALMIHRAGSSTATEAAFKYLLLSAVASAMILFGISLAYGTVDSLTIKDFAGVVSNSGGLGIAAAALMLSGFFLKAAVFPFHGWAPDAYSGVRLQVTTFLASVVKAAVVLGLVRVFGAAVLGAELTMIVMVLGIVSIFYGNITAIRQKTFKRLLAYSSIAHAGYMIFALADRSAAGGEAILYYLFIYAMTTIVACSCFKMLVPADSDDLDALEGAFWRAPLPALLLALSALSFAGIPPLPGFLAKFFIFKAVVASGYLAPAVLAFAGSFVGVTFYLGLVYRIFKPGVQTAATQSVMTGWARGGVLLGAALLLLFTVAPVGMVF